MSSKPRISDYRKVEDKILLIQPLESENDFKLSIYDCQTKMARACLFPLLLKIKEVKLFDYDKDIYHVILVHEDLNTCLWTTTETPLHFGRTVCTNTQIKSDMESSFFLDRSRNSQIFLNFRTQTNQQKTLRSTNKGRTWNEITILNPNKFKYDEPVHFIFSRHDPRNVPETFTEGDIQYQVLKDGLQPFITYDKGNSWTAAPKTRSNIILLNYGMVLLSIDKDTDYINYSFDYANTWIRHKVFNLKPKVLYIGRLTETDQKALIIIKMSLTNLIKFSIIDFSKYFELDCTDEQYQLWDLPTSDGFCHHGTIVEMTTRIPDNLCVDKKDMHISFESICSCTPDYFGCTYGYQPFSDLCVPDSLFGNLQQTFKCKYESYHNIEDQRGFIKIQKNICLPHIDYRNKNQISSEFCGNYDHTNFLLLYSSTHLYISRVLTYSTDVMIKRPISMDIYLNPTMGKPFAFDFPGQIIYSYNDKRITKYPFFGTLQQSIYYLNDDVMAMVYDPLTHVLVYLTRKNRLKLLSTITNFQQIFYEEVVTFKYIPYQRYISFVTYTNYVCYSDLREKPICYRPHFNVLQAYVDREQYTMYLLTSLHVLEIVTFVNNITDIKLLTKIPDVDDFTVFKNNLYYLTQGNLMHMKMGNLFERFLIDANHHFTHLVFHRVYLQIIKCGCPGNMIQYNNECICPENSPNCLANSCAGFFCDNSICLPDNVKCNGSNDCGDNSDEINCSHKCTENNHLCLGSCMSKDIVCGDDHIMDTPKDQKFSLTHISMFFCKYDK
ncbi:Sortilin-related receptor [Thelohanellus kitauei]|uniref:Sortilin-related receptor n=1 Tax=Thelohanellus kitauei TaxID=669202 RepID=A0A0C2IPU3_THEKT|nr:Sortilin-related receptor [Thelohanellus kitauei]